jgi:hypothetical protein
MEEWAQEVEEPAAALRAGKAEIARMFISASGLRKMK